MGKGSTKGWIGLELGHRSITIAQIQRSAGSLRVLAAAEMPRLAAPVTESAPCPGYRDVSKQEIESVRLLASGLSGRAAACVLPMSVTELTHASLPPGAPAEQHAMIANEMGHSYSSSRERLQFDFWPSDLPSSEESPLTDVNVIAVAESRAAQLAESLAAARLDCRALDGLPHAVARAVRMAVPDHFGRPLAALHLAYDNAIFVLSRDGVPVFTRQMRNSGMHRLVTSVSESLGLVENEAIQVLREFGLRGPELAVTEAEQIQDVLSEIVACSLDEIAEELTRTLAYLSTLGTAVYPDSVCLLGDGAAIRNLASHLSTKTDISIWNWDLADSNGTKTNLSIPPAMLAVAASLSSLAWEI